MDLTKEAAKFLESLDAKQFRQVVRKILSLLNDPLPPDSIQLTGYPYRRADVGEYRIIYRIEERTLKVAVIGKRNDGDVYRRVPR